MRPYRSLIAAGLILVCVAPALADDRIPTGMLRATYIATNPVQASRDPVPGELRGPSAAIAREIARRLGAPVKMWRPRARIEAFTCLSTTCQSVESLNLFAEK